MCENSIIVFQCMRHYSACVCVCERLCVSVPPCGDSLDSVCFDNEYWLKLITSLDFLCA